MIFFNNAFYGGLHLVRGYFFFHKTKCIID